MVKTTAAVRRAVEDYVKKLEQEIRVDKVVLFGSYAKGNPRDESDIDIAIVSDDLAHYRPLEKIHVLADRAVGCDTLLAPVGYTVQQYEHADRLSFLGEIKRTGKVIWERGKNSSGKSRRKPARRRKKATPT